MSMPDMMLPWHKNGWVVYDRHQNEITQCYARHSAAYIVTAVNAHAGLLAAAKETVKAVHEQRVAQCE